MPDALAVSTNAVEAPEPNTSVEWASATIHHGNRAKIVRRDRAKKEWILLAVAENGAGRGRGYHRHAGASGNLSGGHGCPRAPGADYRMASFAVECIARHVQCSHQALRPVALAIAE
eukprot:2730707-Prymnesium_polylepis.2